MTFLKNKFPLKPLQDPLNPKRFLKETGLFLADILYNAIIIILLVVLIRSFLISPFRVIGSSMADTLASNEFILIDKLSYRLDVPERGDPIVFQPPITNKYSYKFEEEVTTDAEGKGELRLKPLKTSNNVLYCQNPWMKQLWFCQNQVRAGDLFFILQAKTSGERPIETDWEKAEEHLLSADEEEEGVFRFTQKPEQSYFIRIYDAAGPEYFVKRIIGIPGDTIKIENGRVYLKKDNGTSFVEVEESYLNEENRFHTYFNQAMDTNEFLIPEGHYFVLGDNRNHSNDSRSWFAPIKDEYTPYVSLNQINGKVLVVLWPLPKLRLIEGAALE